MPGHAVHSQPTPIEYLDFEVEIGPGNGLLYPLAVLSSPAGQAREIMSFPFDSMAGEPPRQAGKRTAAIRHHIPKIPLHR